MARLIRIDSELVRRGLARSREHASELIAARRAQLEQQLLDIEQMQLELDTAEERCLAALAETQA